jgi:aryl-alcohol dehydrogenase-like predicted oxidoreductase
MQLRLLGRTGERVSAIGLGGFHIGKQADEHESIRIIRSAINRGITFMDNCWDYNGGASEVRMGKGLGGGYRERVFLMTKIDGRTKEAATNQIEESLRRLQTDHIGLLQFHEIIRMEDPERIFAPGGAIEAVLGAQQEARSAILASRGTRTRRSISRRSTSQQATDSVSTRCRCR